MSNYLWYIKALLLIDIDDPLNKRLRELFCILPATAPISRATSARRSLTSVEKAESALGRVSVHK